jgi:hypothetical protein
MVTCTDLSIAVSMLASTPATAPQDTVRVPDQVTCPKCTIKLTRLGRIGVGAGAAGPMNITSVNRDLRGRFYLTPTYTPGTISEFDQNGKFVRAIGKRGAGPQEFDEVTWVDFDRQNQMYAIDRGNRRIAILDTARKVVSSIPLRINPYNFMALRDGRIFVTANGSDPKKRGVPLHEIDRNGAVIRSFGDPERELDPRQPQRHWRALGLGSNNTIWVARADRYQIERYSDQGVLSKVFVSTPSWYQPWQRPAGSLSERRPFPRMNMVREDARGRLWTFTVVADSDWKPRPKPPAGKELMLPTVRERHALEDSIVEVLDPVAGRVIARARWPKPITGWWMPIAKDPIVFTKDVDDEGRPFVEMWSISVVQQRS